MTKTTKTTFANDVTRRFKLSDRDVQRQLQYFIDRWISDVKWNSNKKRETNDNRETEKLNMYIEHKEQGVDLDNDRILQLNQDIEWFDRLISINNDLLEMMQEASQQLFPEEHATSEDVASTLTELEAKYQAQKAAS